MHPLAEWQARVTRATDAWRLVLARGHAFAGNGVYEALTAVDEQRAVVVGHLNKHHFGDAKTAADQLRGYKARQVYRRLQVVALEREVAMMRLVADTSPASGDEARRGVRSRATGTGRADDRGR